MNLTRTDEDASPQAQRLISAMKRIPEEVAARSQPWQGGAEIRCVAQRQVFNAAMDLYDVLLVLKSEFPEPAGGPPRRMLDPSAPDRFDDRPTAGEGPPERELRMLARGLRAVSAQGLAIIAAWRRDAIIAAPLAQELAQQAQALLPLMEHLYTDFNQGAVRADAEDQEAIREEARQEAARLAVIHNQIYLGTKSIPWAWSHLAWCADSGRNVALARDRGQVIVSLGIPDMGKTQLALTQFEAALRPRRGLTADAMPPTAVAAFHVDLTGTGLPGLLAALFPNPRPGDAQILQERLGVLPEGLPRVVLAVPAWLLADYEQMLHAAYGPTWPAGLLLLPLKFPLWQLGLRGLEVMLGADQEAAYVQDLLDKAQALGNQLTGARWRELIEHSAGLTAKQKEMAIARLQPLLRLEGDEQDGDLWDLVEPGTLTIVALAGRWLSKGVALPTIAALMNGIAQHSERHGAFQRFYFLDEVSELEGDAKLWAQIVTAARQVRHWSNTLWIAGQDLMGLPDQLLGLATVCVVFCLRSAKVYDALRKRLAGLSRWSLKRIMRLGQGEAVMVTTASSDEQVAQKGIRVRTRPPACAHGGHTRTVF